MGIFASGTRVEAFLPCPVCVGRVLASYNFWSIITSLYQMVQRAVRCDLIAAGGTESSINAYHIAIGLDLIVIRLNPNRTCPNITVLVLLSPINRRKAKHPGLVLAKPSDQRLVPFSL
jgi:hypothetical protein